MESSAAIARGLTRDAGRRWRHPRDGNRGGRRPRFSTAEAAQLVNTGELKVGEEVAVVAEGRIQRAEVRRAVDEAKGNLRALAVDEVTLRGQKYEAGFSTSQPKLLTVGRRDVYANRKPRAKLSKTALALRRAGGRGGARW